DNVRCKLAVTFQDTKVSVLPNGTALVATSFTETVTNEFGAFTSRYGRLTMVFVRDAGKARLVQLHSSVLHTGLTMMHMLRRAVASVSNLSAAITGKAQGAQKGGSSTKPKG